jgi:hypothetical protein
VTSHFDGWLVFPRELLVAENALGQTFRGTVASATLTVISARLPSDPPSGGFMLEGPVGMNYPDGLLPDVRWGYRVFSAGGRSVGGAT